MDQATDSLRAASMLDEDASTTRTPLPYYLRDFTATSRVLVIAALAAIIGCAGAVLAWVLLKLIFFFTNLF